MRSKENQKGSDRLWKAVKGRRQADPLTADGVSTPERRTNERKKDQPCHLQLRTQTSAHEMRQGERKLLASILYGKHEGVVSLVLYCFVVRDLS